MIEIKPVDKFNPTLLKQYVYCPIIPWINAVLMVREPVSDSMRIGAESIKPPQGKGQVYVKTRRGSAIIDEVEEKEGSRTIIERKKYGSHNYSRYIAQVAASYLVTRESHPGIRTAKLEIGGKSMTIELCKDLVEDIEKLVEKLEKTLQREKPPESKPKPGKCKSCWYTRYCPHW
ncbi:MAG: CRISPR-associated protein Cas4 [Thermosphaera sp.]